MKNFLLLMTMLSNFAFAQLNLLDERKERQGLGQKEECGGIPRHPGYFEELFNLSAKKSYDAYNQCVRRNERRESLDFKRRNEEIVYVSRANCREAVKRISRNPSTVSFDYDNKYDSAYGFNSAGIYITEGGYSLTVRGSDVDGRFSVKCFVDKNYMVRHLQ